MGEKSRKGNKGFTLLELLIVLAIISVLVAVTVPVFMSALERSRRAVDISNARSLSAVLSSKIMDGTVEVKDEKIGIAVLVDKNGPKVYIVDAKGRLGSRSNKVKVNGMNGMNGTTLQGIINGSGLESVKIESRRVDWYCVTVYGDWKSEYYEGNGTVKIKEENKVEWSSVLSE